jgi:hypothetical protein
MYTTLAESAHIIFTLLFFTILRFIWEWGWGGMSVMNREILCRGDDVGADDEADNNDNDAYKGE